MEMTDSPTKSPKSPNFDRSPRDRADLPSVVAVEGDAVTSGASASGAGGSLFVGKLAFDCRTRELEDLFGKYGRITRCDIKRGYAFIEFEDERDATDAIKYLDGTRFLGLNITVERTKGEKRAATNPDGSRSRECFKCGRVGHYARECRSGGGRSSGGDRSERRDRVDRYERRDYRDSRDSRDYRDSRDSRDSRDYRDNRDSRRRSRSRSPQRNRSVSRSPPRY